MQENALTNRHVEHFLQVNIENQFFIYYLFLSIFYWFYRFREVAVDNFKSYLVGRLLVTGTIYTHVNSINPIARPIEQGPGDQRRESCLG